MANTIYENFILESKLSDLLNTKMAVRSYMKVDDSLTEAPGMIKKINTYTYSGKAEKVAKGQKNSTRGAVTYTSKQYEVEVTQQVFDYYDEEAMQDPKVVDMGMEGSATVMVNDMNTKFFAELAKATLEHKATGSLKYDDVVDAIQLMNLEDENGLFLIIGTDLKAEIRKDVDFKAAKQGEILFNGQIGSISGVPVVVSKLVPKATAYLATKEAVTLFVKKESEVEQDRDKEARLNTIIMRKVNLVALTDATKVVKITKAEK
ncbi:hypothetical protein ACV30I_13465 [Clostridium perfringens]